MNKIQDVCETAIKYTNIKIMEFPEGKERGNTGRY